MIFLFINWFAIVFVISLYA